MTAGSSKYKFYLLIIFLFAINIPKTLDERDIVFANTYSSMEIDECMLQSGDLIFRRGISFVSNLVLEADSESPYSHVGIITIDSGKAFVIHAVPEESESGIDYLRKDPMKTFLLKDRATAYAVFRFYDDLIADKAAHAANNYFSKKYIFDASFNLLDPNELYCTELVWRAYKDVGVNITNNRFDTLAVPIGENPFLLPGTLLNSECLSQITKSSIFK